MLLNFACFSFVVRLPLSPIPHPFLKAMRIKFHARIETVNFVILSVSPAREAHFQESGLQKYLQKSTISEEWSETGKWIFLEFNWRNLSKLINSYVAKFIWNSEAQNMQELRRKNKGKSKNFRARSARMFPNLKLELFICLNAQMLISLKKHMSICSYAQMLFFKHLSIKMLGKCFF